VAGMKETNDHAKTTLKKGNQHKYKFDM